VLRLITLSLLLTSFAIAQTPRIGIIDFYGLRKVTQTKVLQALGVREGDPLPPSKGDTEERLDAVQGIVESHLEAVCCDAGKMILYVGLEERGAPHFELREPPDGEMKLPEEITATYRQFVEASAVAARKGETAEDLTNGHALSSNVEARAIQEEFIPLAKDHLRELRDVLRNCNDEEQRATAAYVIGYAPRKAEIVDDLQYALRDADAGVRYNATRGLGALAVLARIDKNSDVKISPTWLIEMLNSLSWSDRNKAMVVLQILSDSPDASLLDQLRERALTSLVEMARWKTLSHALPAYMLVGRIAGLPDTQVQEAWSRGDRESVIAQATGKKRK
jgi:hypothetical protein